MVSEVDDDGMGDIEVEEPLSWPLHLELLVAAAAPVVGLVLVAGLCVCGRL